MTPTDGAFEPRIVMQDLTDAMVCYESVRAMRRALERAASKREMYGNKEGGKVDWAFAARVDETLRLLQAEVTRLRLLSHPEHGKVLPN